MLAAQRILSSVNWLELMAPYTLYTLYISLKADKIALTAVLGVPTLEEEQVSLITL